MTIIITFGTPTCQIPGLFRPIWAQIPVAIRVSGDPFCKTVTRKADSWLPRPNIGQLGPSIAPFWPDLGPTQAKNDAPA